LADEVATRPRGSAFRFICTRFAHGDINVIASDAGHWM